MLAGHDAGRVYIGTEKQTIRLSSLIDLQFGWPFSIIVFRPDCATASRPLASGKT